MNPFSGAGANGLFIFLFGPLYFYLVFPIILKKYAIIAGIAPLICPFFLSISFFHPIAPCWPLLAAINPHWARRPS
jgi:hypothetical protein